MEAPQRKVWHLKLGQSSGELAVICTLGEAAERVPHQPGCMPAVVALLVTPNFLCRVQGEAKCNAIAFWVDGDGAEVRRAWQRVCKVINFSRLVPMLQQSSAGKLQPAGDMWDKL